MKLSVTIFILLASGIFKALLANGTVVGLDCIYTPNTITTSTNCAITDFSVNKGVISFISFTPVHCNWWTLCINELVTGAVDLAIATIDIAIAIFDIVLIVVNIIVLAGQIIALLSILIVTPLPGIPSWLNMLLMLVPTIMLFVSIIQLFKPGSSSEE